MKNSVRATIICGVIVVIIFALPVLALGAERYTPLAREYIERAKAKLKQEEAPQAQRVVKQERLRLRDEIEVEDIMETEQIPSLLDYYLAVGDTMEIYVWEHDDLCKTVVIGPDGKLSYPLLGRPYVVGLTIGQLEKKIEEALSIYIRYPQVSVMMRSFTGNKVIVLGQIRSPGIYTYQGQIDLIEAIAMSGDFTEDACQDSVIVVRGNLTGNPRAMRIDMSQVIKKGTSKTDILLRPDDVVYVPKSFIANLNRFLGNVSPAIGRATSMLGIKEYRDIQNKQELVGELIE